MNLKELNLKYNESLLSRKLDILLNLTINKNSVNCYSFIQIKLQVKSALRLTKPL